MILSDKMREAALKFGGAKNAAPFPSMIVIFMKIGADISE